MSENIIEYWRKCSIEELFKLQSMKKVWPIWEPIINSYITPLNANNLFNLGDHLYDIFQSTNTKSSTSTTTESEAQSDVSTGGTVWEALVCWYLNLCLIGRNTIVVKHKRQFLPQCISDAITVKYGSTTSNTESDLIAITFPDNPLLSCDKDTLALTASDGNPVKLYGSRGGKYKLTDVINVLTDQLFNEVEIHIIQCKTNWNDNAQIPMLWDMVYSAKGFKGGIKVGTNGKVINPDRFSYSFVTVPTVKPTNFTPTSVAVKRVENITGGNYWGLPSKSGVANNIKEMLGRNLENGSSTPILSTLSLETGKSDFNVLYSYFKMLTASKGPTS